MKYFKRHNDDEWYDEVRIVTIPRYKTSELSGDEWRTSAVLQICRKRIVLVERPFFDIETAAKWLSWGLVEATQPFVGMDDFPKDLCDQPGCAEKATTIYRLKELFERNGTKSEYQGDEVYRGFCARHSERGDCGLEDAAANYELVVGTAPTQGTRNSDDATPAVFGGIVELDLEE